MSDAPALSRDIEALIRYIEERSDMAHGWRRGRDCVSFALGGVEAQTGIDVLAPIELWKNKREALKVARDHGGLLKKLNAWMDPVAPALAKRGDVAGLADKDFGVRLMLIEGPTLVGPGKKGLERLPRQAMARAWNAETVRELPA
ncbi:MAG: hypothetical protein AAFO28_05435 [Pseudomonadota bacterium]